MFHICSPGPGSSENEDATDAPDDAEESPGDTEMGGGGGQDSADADGNPGESGLGGGGIPDAANTAKDSILAKILDNISSLFKLATGNLGDVFSSAGNPGAGNPSGPMPMPGSSPGSKPGPGSGPGSKPGPGSGPGSKPGPGSGPGSKPGAGSGEGLKPGPGSGPGSKPGPGSIQGSKPPFMPPGRTTVTKGPGDADSEGGEGGDPGMLIPDMSTSRRGGSTLPIGLVNKASIQGFNPVLTPTRRPPKTMEAGDGSMNKVVNKVLVQVNFDKKNLYVSIGSYERERQS